MITDAVRRYVAAGIALAAIALAAWSGSAIRGWIDGKEIKRIDEERIAAVEAEAKIIAATEYAKSESEILAAKWRDGANESQAKSKQLLAAIAVDRDRLAVDARRPQSPGAARPGPMAHARPAGARHRRPPGGAAAAHARRAMT